MYLFFIYMFIGPQFMDEFILTLTDARFPSGFTPLRAV